MAKETIEQVDVAGKRVLIRADFNVPMEGGEIRDDRRIREAIPTIRSVLSRGGAVVLLSHAGRPEGNGYEAAHSLEPVARRLGELLGVPVRVPSRSAVDEAAMGAARALRPGEVLLLENLRFEKGEKSGDAGLAARLAALGDIYVNDAFGTAHRSDASMVALPTAMAGKPRVAGLLLQRELRYLGDMLAAPARPFVVVMGGAKVSDKIPVLEHLLPRTDAVLIGGAMAYTFLRVLGRDVGGSRVEEGSLAAAKRVLDLAATRKTDLHLPKDHVCSTVFAATGGQVSVHQDAIPAGSMGLDIGPKTVTDFALVIRRAKTVVWNGPMGVFEWPAFSVGTHQVAQAVAHATTQGATTIVGGGDTAAAAEAFGVADKVTHVSTGGGASLEMLAGANFPSVALLDEA
ncbi:MAG TPA: phosphoglycerate kinase [Phycisphaerales bacterium]|nr:phosphoglycerate kinase [Phycisphaerales bacterium]